MTVDGVFRLLMERADNALQSRGIILPGAGAAMADWQRFSTLLRGQFFEMMRSASATKALISEASEQAARSRRFLWLS
jgi:hypothetical protein